MSHYRIQVIGDTLAAEQKILEYLPGSCYTNDLVYILDFQVWQITPQKEVLLLPWKDPEFYEEFEVTEMFRVTGICNIDQVYQKVFGSKWVGRDPGALEERLRDLLLAEKQLIELQKDLAQVKKLFK